MDFTLWTKKRYVSFYNKRNRLVSFIHKPWSIKVGFLSKNQLPLLLIWKEYYVKGKVDYAEVLFSVYPMFNPGVRQPELE